MTKIRIIERKKSNYDPEYFISVDDLYSFLNKHALLDENYRNKSWDFVQQMFSKWIEGFNKKEVTNFNQTEFMLLDFQDYFIPMTRIDMEIRTIIRNNLRELFSFIDNENKLVSEAYLHQSEKDFKEDWFKIIKINLSELGLD